LIPYLTFHLHYLALEKNRIIFSNETLIDITINAKYLKNLYLSNRFIVFLSRTLNENKVEIDKKKPSQKDINKYDSFRKPYSKGEEL